MLSLLILLIRKPLDRCRVILRALTGVNLHAKICPQLTSAEKVEQGCTLLFFFHRRKLFIHLICFVYARKFTPVTSVNANVEIHL